MKNHPIIFARSNTGSILEWHIEQDGDKYRVVSGTQDGKKTTSEFTTAIAKNVGKVNATTGEEQALAEIKARYKKQLKSGDYFSSVDEIDNQRYFHVMLAKEYKDYKDKIDWTKGVGVQIKYNGGRVYATKDGLFSRKGEKYISIPHIEEALIPFFKRFPDAILDGEGFNYELREKLNEIMKLLRKTVHITAQDFQRSRELIRFYIYDGFGFPFEKDGKVVTAQDCYLTRKKAIDNAFFAPCFADKYKDIIDKVPTWIVNSEYELEQLYKKFLDNKQEGAILRILGQPYENKRTKYLLKYKPVDDAEYKILDIEEGEGNWSGMAKVITCKRIDNKQFADGTDTFNATFKGTMEEAKKFLIDKNKFIGKVVTIYFNGFTGKGKPNYARFDINNWDKGS